MKPFHFWVAAQLVLSLLSGINLMQGRAVYRRSISDIEDMSAVNCETEMREKCSSFNPSHNYSMKISSQLYSTGQEIKVKVHMTHCPLEDLSGPMWYQLEIVTNVSQPSSHERKDLGVFYPQQRHALFCDYRTRVVFASCDPKSYDLPASYVWIAPWNNSPSEEICFRLTVQEDGNYCEEELICVQPLESDQEPDDAHLELGSGSGHDYDSDPYPAPNSDDNYGIDDSTLTSSCESDKDFYIDSSSDWIPHCTCKGFYAPVQCWMNNGEMECWCSTALMGYLTGVRKKIVCTDPSEVM